MIFFLYYPEFFTNLPCVVAENCSFRCASISASYRAKCDVAQYENVHTFLYTENIYGIFSLRFELYDFV